MHYLPFSVAVEGIFPSVGLDSDALNSAGGIETNLRALG